jgi:hypothetical protein
VSTLTRRTWTPPEFAKWLRVAEEKVLGWIRAGELRAVNVAARNCRRPRYRIDQLAIDEFLAARTVNPPLKMARRGRQLTEIIAYY